jgi:hypothetical protein
VIYKLFDWSSGPRVLKDGVMDVVLGLSKKKKKKEKKKHVLCKTKVVALNESVIVFNHH